MPATMEVDRINSFIDKEVAMKAKAGYTIGISISIT